MSQINIAPPPTIRRQTGAGGKSFIDYKQTEELRRMLTPNGKMLSRKRLSLSAADQRMVASAIKRARFLALLPFTNAAN